MSLFKIQQQTLVDIANAVREKRGTTDLIKVSELPAEIANIQAGGGGGHDNFDALIEGTLTEVSSDTVESIKTYAFYNENNITKASFPNAHTLGESAFCACKNLQKVEIPLVTGLPTYAFDGCSALTDVDCSSVIDIRTMPFSGTSIEELLLPNLTSLGSSSLGGMANLKFVSVPLLGRIPVQTFYNDKSLARLDFPSLTRIDRLAFDGCTSLDTLILRIETAVCRLGNIDAFEDTLIASGTGYIYVPKALLSDDDATKDYRRATNWSTYAEQFRAIEDYPDICGGTV